jgi:methylenetetrahydrofolate reductase (NADPH)
MFIPPSFLLFCIKFTTWCKTRVPQPIRDALNGIKGDDEAVKTYGVQLAVESCRRLLSEAERGTGCRAVHFYTMNLATAVTKILRTMKVHAHMRGRGGRVNAE